MQFTDVQKSMLFLKDLFCLFEQQSARQREMKR